VTELPLYAIKEFKLGPLYYFVFVHNKLVLERSFSGLLGALSITAQGPQRYRISTSLEALQVAAERENARTPQDFIKGYGHLANADAIIADKYRLSLRRIIVQAWKKRRDIATSVVLPLSCYQEVAPYIEDGILKLDPQDCVDKECCLAGMLKQDIKSLQAIKAILRSLSANSGKREHQRQYQIVTDIIRKQREPVTRKMCRGLGDVIFAIFCPRDAVILTTNVADHEPLAAALGKSVDSPADRASGKSADST
jgi:hypothetical protein